MATGCVLRFRRFFEIFLVQPLKPQLPLWIRKEIIPDLFKISLPYFKVFQSFLKMIISSFPNSSETTTAHHQFSASSKLQKSFWNLHGKSFYRRGSFRLLGKTVPGRFIAQIGSGNNPKVNRFVTVIDLQIQKKYHPGDIFLTMDLQDLS